MQKVRLRTNTNGEIPVENSVKEANYPINSIEDYPNFLRRTPAQQLNPETIWKIQLAYLSGCKSR